MLRKMILQSVVATLLVAAAAGLYSAAAGQFPVAAGFHDEVE